MFFPTPVPISTVQTEASTVIDVGSVVPAPAVQAPVVPAPAPVVAPAPVADPAAEAKAK